MATRSIVRYDEIGEVLKEQGKPDAALKTYRAGRNRP